MKEKQRPGKGPDAVRQEKEVFITIQSSQNYGDDVEVMPELITRGAYRCDKDGIRLSYMESELTGLGGTETVFQVRPDEVIMTRMGEVNSRMVFRQGQPGKFSYDTQFGALRMGMDTRKLQCALDEHGGSMEIVYDLGFNSSFLSRNTFKIKVQESGKAVFAPGAQAWRAPAAPGPEEDPGFLFEPDEAPELPFHFRFREKRLPS